MSSGHSYHTIRFPMELYIKLKERAALHNRSFSAEVVHLVTKQLDDALYIDDLVAKATQEAHRKRNQTG